MRRVLLLLTIILSITKLFAQIPTITSVTKTSSTLTINGTNFGTTPTSNIVYIGDVKTSIVSSTATKIRIALPLTAAQTYKPLSVTVNGLTAYYFSNLLLTKNTISTKYYSFAAPYSVDTVFGIETTDIATGDFDNDNKIDIAVVDRLNDSVTIYKNTTVGNTISFGGKISYKTGHTPRCIKVADINGDGKQDIVVANQNDSSISVFVNNSSSSISFNNQINIRVGQYPNDIAIADFNKDGKLDIATANLDLYGNISILKNTGTTSTIQFGTFINQSLGGIINSITANDFNSDGLFDIAVANETYNEVRILKNTSSAGNISFINAATVAAGTQPESIISADFNGDNLPDIAVSNWQSANISTIQNTTVSGTTSFGSSVNYTSYTNPNALAVGDLVPDGYPEILSVSNATGFNVFANNATATIGFNNAYSRPYPSTGLKSAIADFDNDGKNDIATTSFALRVNVYRNTNGSPIITDFNPKYGKTGDTIIISGHNFKLGTFVKISLGGDSVSSYKVRNDSTIRVNVGAGSTGDVVVKNDYSEARMSGFVFDTITHPINKDTLILEGCNSGVIYKGNTYTSSTNFNDTIKSVFGYDSIYRQVNVFINIITPVNTVSNISGCNSVTYKGIHYTTSMVINDTIKSIHGCDSIYNLVNIKLLGVRGKIPYAYIVSSNIVSVFNVAADTLVARISVGPNATGIGISPDGIKVYVSNFISNSVSVINTSTNTILATIGVGTNPRSVIVSPDGTKVYVVNQYGNTVSVINALSNSIDATISVGGNPFGISISPDGSKVFVTNSDSGTVSVISANTNTVVATIPVGLTPSGICISPDGTKLYVTNTSSNLVSIIEVSNNTVIATIPVGLFPIGICISPDGTKLYVANNHDYSVSVINTITNVLVGTIGVGPFPLGLSISPDGTKLYVANSYSITVTVINTSNNAYMYTIYLISEPTVFGNFITNVPSFIGATIDTINLTGCSGSIIYKGTTYYSSTTLKDTIKNYQGCDSVYNFVSILINDVGISGNIITPNGKPVKFVNTKLNGITNLQAYSKYNYSCLTQGSNNTVKSTKNNDITKANGINTTDVLFVQRHILNTTKLNSAYKLIAADVNGDKVVNATDLLRIKRLILGTDTTFTKGSGINKVDRLWEFVDSAYQFPDTTNPFPFKDSISFTNLTSNKINQTFIGIKLGDVNDSWNPAVAKGVEVKPVEFVYEFSNSYRVLNPIRVKVAVNNFKDIVAMQYTLHFDNTKYEFVSLEGFKNLQGFDYNTTQANTNGNISFLWTDKNAVEKSLEDGTELFTLVLTQKGIGNWELGISDAITEIAAWDKDFNQHSIILTKREITTNNSPLTTNQWSVNPNPTSGEIKVSILSKVNKTVSFELTDAQGKTILKQAIELQKGSNSFTLNLKQNGNIATGIYFLKAVGVEGDNVKRIMVK